MVAYLEKSDANTEFHQKVDFISSCSITYALTTSVPMKLKADEAVNQEEGDIVERVITTDAILEAVQDSDNITETQTTVMPNVNIPQGIDTGGRPRRQETMGEGHTSGSGEERLEENIELTDTVPTPYDSPLTGVKKLESQLKHKRSKAVIHSSDEEGPSVHIEDSPKHERTIEEMDKDKNINLRSLAKDKEKEIMQETELSKKLKNKEMIHLSLDAKLAQKLYVEELAKEEARQEHEIYNLEKALELQR
nr:hypothetical protein [Tanacetum cinerariifolium]